MHRHFAKPRSQVEDEFNEPAQTSDGKSLQKPSGGATQHSRGKPKQKPVGAFDCSKAQPRDPNEDDFVR